MAGRVCGVGDSEECMKAAAGGGEKDQEEVRERSMSGQRKRHLFRRSGGRGGSQG